MHYALGTAFLGVSPGYPALHFPHHLSPPSEKAPSVYSITRIFISSFILREEFVWLIRQLLAEKQHGASMVYALHVLPNHFGHLCVGDFPLLRSAVFAIDHRDDQIPKHRPHTLVEVGARHL
jgi:hypothetical protein